MDKQNEDQQVVENATEQQAEVAATNDAPVTGDVLKIPIFIGTEDKSIIDKLEKELDDKYELAVMSPNVVAHSKQAWYMSKLQEAERNHMVEVKKNEKARASAMDIAVELDTYFNGNVQFPNGDFHHYHVKNYFREARKPFTGGEKPNTNVSNRDVRNIIDMLGLHGFLFANDPTLNYEKRSFRILLDDSTQLLFLQTQIQKYQNEKGGLDVLISATEQQLAEVSERITKEADAALPDVPAMEEQQPEALAKKSKRKAKGTTEEAVNNNGELQATTEHLNDRSNDNGSKPVKRRSKRSDSEPI